MTVHPEFTKTLQKGAIDSLLPEGKIKGSKFTPRVCQLLKNRRQLISVQLEQQFVVIIQLMHSPDAPGPRLRGNIALNMVAFKCLGVQYKK